MTLDLDAIADVMATVAREAAAEAEARLLGRIGALEAKIATLTLEKGDTGEQGLRGHPGEPGPQGPAGVDGKDADLTAIEAHIEKVVGTLVAQAVTLIPVPENGKDGINGVNGKDAPPVTSAQVMDAIKALPDVVDAAVTRYLTVHPPANGTDGVGLVGGVIDREGHLILTCSDGSTKTLDVVVGRDGKNGEPGPPGRDGLNGEPGKNGRDFDLKFFESIAYDSERGFIWRFIDGDFVKEHVVSVPAIIHKGIWDADVIYPAGSCVTYGGSMWIAKQETKGARPGLSTEESRVWILSVKVGRDGKQGPPGEKGMDGKDGRPGKDLTQIGPDGSKWR